MSALPGQLEWYKTFYRQNWLAQEVINGSQYHDVFTEGETASSLTNERAMMFTSLSSLQGLENS